MNKVITINLSGRLITIDEEAYVQLNAYLKWLQQFFSKEEGGLEIYRDMEDRIAELFEDKLRKSHVSISADDVQTVIQIMGSPEQIAMETSDNYEEVEKGNTTTDNLVTEVAPKENDGKLKRNLANRVVGGVCSGLAHYFKADPFLIRLLMVVGTLFYGTTILAYLLLWIILPGYYYSQTSALKKRWYRSNDGKVLGGVCSGLSSQLNISKQWLRVIFAFPLFGVILFNIINEDDLASFCTAALPTMTIIYIVLWLALPQASSLTQKMELKGERLDVQNISSALREQNESQRSGVEQSSPLSTVLRIFAYIVLGFLIVIIGSVLVSLLVAMLGLLFGFSTVGWGLWPLTDLIFKSQAHAWILYIASILTVLIPILAIIRWLMIRLNKNAPKRKWVGYSLGTMFLVSLFAVVFICSNLFADFKHYYTSSETLNMQQPKDTLNIAVMKDRNDDGDDWEIVKQGSNGKKQLQIASLAIEASDDNLFHLNLLRQSNGENAQNAKALADGVKYTFEQDSNNLYLPKYLELGDPELFRGQLLTAKLQVPKGQVFKVGDMPVRYAKSWQMRALPVFSIKVKQHKWQPNTLYRVGDDGVVEIVE